jgi:hypothetical protein
MQLSGSNVGHLLVEFTRACTLGHAVTKIFVYATMTECGIVEHQECYSRQDVYHTRDQRWDMIENRYGIVPLRSERPLKVTSNGVSEKYVIKY